jgi:hypothetical protein
VVINLQDAKNATAPSWFACPAADQRTATFAVAHSGAASRPCKRLTAISHNPSLLRSFVLKATRTSSATRRNEETKEPTVLNNTSAQVVRRGKESAAEEALGCGRALGGTQA